MRADDGGEFDALGAEWANATVVIWEEEADNPAEGPEEKGEEEAKRDVAFFSPMRTPMVPLMTIQRMNANISIPHSVTWRRFSTRAARTSCLRKRCAHNRRLARRAAPVCREG